MLKIQEGQKISLRGKDLSILRGMAKMQKHLMEHKVKIIRPLEAIIPTRGAGLTNLLCKIKQEEIIAQYKIYLVQIKCQSSIHSNNSSYHPKKLSAKDPSRILIFFNKISTNLNNNQQQQTCTKTNLQTIVRIRGTEELETKTLYLKLILKVVKRTMAQVTLLANCQMEGQHETTNMQWKLMLIISMTSMT